MVIDSCDICKVKRFFPRSLQFYIPLSLFTFSDVNITTNSEGSKHEKSVIKDLKNETIQDKFRASVYEPS